MNALVADQHQSIVVVEDDAGMSKATERLLRAAGFQPVSFASAEELLQTEAMDHAVCLVLDIHLPGRSGLELGRLLITSGRAKPLIFITGQDEPSLRDEAPRMRLFSQALRGRSIVGRDSAGDKSRLEAIEFMNQKDLPMQFVKQGHRAMGKAYAPPIAENFFA